MAVPCFVMLAKASIHASVSDHYAGVLVGDWRGWPPSMRSMAAP
jgi:hypothetical protein